MKTSHILLLGSKSPSRKLLLEEAKIPFSIIAQDVDEATCNWLLPLDQVVEQIALHKMNHLIMPSGKNPNDCAFVLTADTLSQDSTGTIHGKPIDHADAIAKIKAARAGAHLSTAFCLDKKVWKNNSWHLEKRIQKIVSASYIFDIPDAWIDFYFENSLGLQASNAIAIEGVGAQFLRTINGSYTTIVGLPMFELREALWDIGFYKF